MIKIFFHLATIGEYQSIHDEIISEVISSGLIDKSDEMLVSIVGNGEVIRNINDKIKYKYVGDIYDFEFPTLIEIEKILNTDNDIKILYLNGLGVTGDTKFKKSWRKYLLHFNVTHHEECLRSLNDGYDVCGVDWRTDPVQHFSGNFWWANSEYLKKLPEITTINKPYSKTVLTLRHNAEMYIGMCDKVNPRILHQSDVSQYERHLFTYELSKYYNNISLENIIKNI